MMTALRKLARKAGLEPSPLRRPVDRAESLVLAGLALICLTAAPVLAIAAGHLAYDAGLQQLRAERSWHQVPATLLQDATASSSSGWDAASVSARWAVPAGHWHTGLVSVGPLAQAGQRVLIWVDGAGNQAQAPIRRATLEQNLFGLEVAVGCGVLIVLAMFAGGVHLAANQRRMAGWERDWRAIAPRWTSPR